MTRAIRLPHVLAHLGLAILFIALSGTLSGSVAQAAKQKVAILGIEATAAANSQIEATDTQLAKELTAALRARANASPSFTLTSENRELVDEKLMNNCASEHPSCMGPIGAQMGAELLLFGKIESTKDGGYKVKLTLINVKSRQQVNAYSEVLTPAQTKGAALANWARAAFNKITGQDTDGSLVVKVINAERGTLLVNGEPRGNVSSGTATIALPEGRYRIGVEADGFRLWEEKDVTIRSGEPTSKTIELARTTGDVVTEPPPDVIRDRTGTVSQSDGNSSLKLAIGIGGLGGALVVGAISSYVWFVGPVRSYENANFTNTSYNMDAKNDGDIGSDECNNGGTWSGENAADVSDKFKSACAWHDRKTALIVAGVGLGTIGAGALIWYYFSKEKTEERPVGASGRVKRKPFAVTPVMTPDGGGATLRFDW